jgi:hypothetical protein
MLSAKIGYFRAKGFDPRSISGLALWLDAADASTITLNGSSVSQWNDKSGNNRHFSQSSATWQPAYWTAAINGRNALAFDGVNDRIGRVNDAWAYNYPVAVFAVFRATSGVWANSYNGLYGFYGNSSGSARSYGVFIKSNGRSAIYAVAGSQHNYDGTGSVTYSLQTTHVFSATIANNSIQGFGDGAEDGSVSGTFTLNTNAPSPLQDMNVGSDPMFSRFTQWLIGEAIIVAGGAISTADRQRVEGYLAHKWGSASRLPANHPYKNSPPT